MSSSVVLLATLFVLGAVLFLVGFFPVTISIAPTNKDNSDLNFKRPASRIYNQTVLMVIDALRADFPTAETMPFVFDRACGRLELRVNIPTVTMPRLKSMTTGTISSFIDIVLNLGHDAKVENSILHDLRNSGYKLVFAGDRTWVDLFPNVFHRKTPNMDSFFVNDFYEGDQNVTRELRAELRLNDWDLLILHYLGLDHIGHVEGSASPKIKPKLLEMDEAIRSIYNAKAFSQQLVLVTGDHGMRNGGGHGGATMEELRVPLLFFKEKCSKKFFKSALRNQIDLAPTLAILMGIEIPTSSIGCLIPELLEDLPYENQLLAYAYNAQHLQRKIRAQRGADTVSSADYHIWLSEAESAHQTFLQSKQKDQIQSVTLFENAKMEYLRASMEMSAQLSSALVDFDYELLTIGLLLSIVVTANVSVRFAVMKNHESTEIYERCRQASLSFVIGIGIQVFLHITQYLHPSSYFRFAVLLGSTVVISYLLLDVLKACKYLKYSRSHLCSFSPTSLFCMLVYGFHICSLASSSFIEEEHKIWFYLCSSTFLLLTFSNLRKTVYLVIGSEFIIIKKLLTSLWAVRSSFLVIIAIAAIQKFDNESYKIGVLICGLVVLSMTLKQFLSLGQWLIASASLLCIYCIRTFDTNEKFNNYILTVFCIAVAAVVISGYKDSFSMWTFKTSRMDHVVFHKMISSHFSCSLLVAALLHKPQHVILISALVYVLEGFYKFCNHLSYRNGEDMTDVLLSKVLLTVFTSKLFFFCQGNSNSLATVDLNPGYIGQSSFNAFIVFVFVTLNTYSAPIHSVFYLTLHLSKPFHSKDEILLFERNLVTSLNMFTIAILLPTAVYMCILTLLRYHLFIYSVFAPKIFYEIFNVVLHYFMFLVIYLYIHVHV